MDTLSWSVHTRALVQRAQHYLHFLHWLRRAEPEQTKLYGINALFFLLLSPLTHIHTFNLVNQKIQILFWSIV